MRDQECGGCAGGIDHDPMEVCPNTARRIDAEFRALWQTPGEFDRWRAQWLATWAAIGWLASTDILQSMAMYNFQVIGKALEGMRALHAQFDNQRRQLDDMSKSLDALRRRLR